MCASPTNRELTGTDSSEWRSAEECFGLLFVMCVLVHSFLDPQGAPLNFLIAIRAESCSARYNNTVRNRRQKSGGQWKSCGSDLKAVWCTMKTEVDRALTPAKHHRADESSEMDPFTCTRWDLPENYEVKHERAVLCMLYRHGVCPRAVSGPSYQTRHCGPRGQEGQYFHCQSWTKDHWLCGGVLPKCSVRIYVQTGIWRAGCCHLNGASTAVRRSVDTYGKLDTGR